MVRPIGSAGSADNYREPQRLRKNPLFEDDVKTSDAGEVLKNSRAFRDHAQKDRALVEKDIKQIRKLEQKLAKIEDVTANKGIIVQLKREITEKQETVNKLLAKANAALKEEHPVGEGHKNYEKGRKAAQETLQIPIKSIEKQLKGLRSFFAFLTGQPWREKDVPKLRQLAFDLEAQRFKASKIYHNTGYKLGKALWKVRDFDKRFPTEVGLQLKKMDDAIKNNTPLSVEALRFMALYLKDKYPEQFEKTMQQGLVFLEPILLEGDIISTSYVRMEEEPTLEEYPLVEEVDQDVFDLGQLLLYIDTYDQNKDLYSLTELLKELNNKLNEIKLHNPHVKVTEQQIEQVLHGLHSEEPKLFEQIVKVEKLEMIASYFKYP